MVGNKPNYTKFDVLRCFFRIGEKISRHDLAKSLELGEGTVRTILDTLKNKELIQSTKKGHFLSSHGISEMIKLKENMALPARIESDSIFKNLKKSAVLVKNSAEMPPAYRLRDIAVKNGSEGAIILKFDKRLYAPEADSEFDYDEIEKYFELRKGDIIVLSFADSYSTAEDSALAAASEINAALKSFINRLSN